jgi:hypothetical protein
MKQLLMTLFCLTVISSLYANNIQISNDTIIHRQNGIIIRFDVKWDNSWRVISGQSNYDGVWVFFKYRKEGTTKWEHLYLSGENNLAPTGASIFQNPSQIIYSNMSLRGIPGTIIYRANEGMGNVNFSNIELGVRSDLPYNIEIRAFAVEMVYIPSALNKRLILGDADGITESAYAFHRQDNYADKTGILFEDSYYNISADAGNNIDDDYLTQANGKLLTINGTGWKTNDGDVNGSWPTAQPLWCMKYEITHGAYRDFLNTLTVAQQTTRTALSPTSPKGTLAMNASSWHKSLLQIETPASGSTPAIYGLDGTPDNYPENGENIACIYLNWMDVAAYLDWSGLSPMTEIVYERICRGLTDAGSNPTLLGQYAWGTGQISSTKFDLANVNLPSESISNQTVTDGLGYANYNATSPLDPSNSSYNGGIPLRNGIFALPNGNRISSGAAFYGVMEMSGNVSEICVTLGNDKGRTFTGNNGDGLLSTNGNAAVYYWPGGSGTPKDQEPGEIKTNTGTIIRGGNYFSPKEELSISNRSQGPALAREWGIQGGRGVLYVY